MKVNSEQEMIWKEPLLAEFKTLFWHLLQWIVKIKRSQRKVWGIPRSHSVSVAGFPEPNSNRGHPEYGAVMLVVWYGDRAKDFTIQGSNPSKDKWFFCSPECPYRLWGPLSFLFSGYQVLCGGIKRLSREVNHSLPSSAEVKNKWGYTSTPVCLHSFYRHKSTFPFYWTGSLADACRYK